MASKVVPIRIPADILERIDTRCMMRKVTRTDVILGALQESFAAKVEPEIPRNTSVAQMSRAVLNIPGVFLGSQLGMNPGPFLTEKADYPGRLEPAHRMCAYSE